MNATASASGFNFLAIHFNSRKQIYATGIPYSKSALNCRVLPGVQSP